MTEDAETASTSESPVALFVLLTQQSKQALMGTGWSVNAAGTTTMKTQSIFA